MGRRLKIFNGGSAGHAGFIYLWVLLIVAMMGAGLTVGADVYVTSLQREKEKELLFVGRQIRDAIGRYHAAMQVAGRNEYPISLDELLKDNRFPGLRRHLRRVYADPMTGKTEWGFVRVSGRIAGVHSKSERTPIKQDNFEPDEAGFRGRNKYSEWVFTYPPDLLLQGQKPMNGQEN